MERFLECRINAEDPERKFMPSPGKIENFILARWPGVRIGIVVYTKVILYHHISDSMLAKFRLSGEEDRGKGPFADGGESTLQEFIIKNNNYTHLKRLIMPILPAW